MKFEVNRVKIRWWLKAFLKETHFLLPVGGAITLTHKSYIHVIGLLQRTHSWSFIKMNQCMQKLWMLCVCFLFPFSRHKFVSSPRPNRSRYQKVARNLASSVSWLHAGRVWRWSGESSRRSIANSRACVFKQPIIAHFLLGWRKTVSTKVVRPDELYMGTEFHICTCKRFWFMDQVKYRIQGGAVEPPCHARVPSSARPWWPRILMRVQIFKSFRAR